MHKPINPTTQGNGENAVPYINRIPLKRGDFLLLLFSTKCANIYYNK